MKSIFKIMMAMVVFCLPLALVSCGDDDDDNGGPKIFNYSWELTNASPDSSDPTALSEAATAITEAHKAFANAFKGLGATVDESKHSFTINGGSESQNKLNVQAAVLQAKAILLTGATQKLNKDARIIVKQGSKEIHNSKLGEV